MSAEDCVGCRHINNCLGDCVGYEEVKPQKQTNFDRITQSEEVLADFMEKMDRYVNICDLIGGCEKCPFEHCYDEHHEAKLWLWWLKQESKE